MAIAFILCSYLAKKEAPRFGLDSSFVYDLVFWLAIGGILGARLFYIFLNLSFYVENPLEMIMIQKGGLAFQGGFIGATLAGVFHVSRRNIPLLKVFDFVAPYVALGHALGRLGCFLNGCCYGRHWDHGIYFPTHEDHLHPTQLYAAAGLFLIFFILKQYSKSLTLFQGKVFALYLVLATALRFTVEFFRADHFNLYLGLSVFQWMSIALFLFGLYLFRLKHNK